MTDILSINLKKAYIMSFTCTFVNVSLYVFEYNYIISASKLKQKPPCIDNTFITSDNIDCLNLSKNNVCKKQFILQSAILLYR